MKACGFAASVVVDAVVLVLEAVSLVSFATAFAFAASTAAVDLAVDSRGSEAVGVVFDYYCSVLLAF